MTSVTRKSVPLVLALLVSTVAGLSASASEDAAIRITVPDSRIARTTALTDGGGSFSPAVSVGFSSWVPGAIGIGTYRGGPVKLQSSFPMTYASMGIPFGTIAATDFSAVIGLGYMSMSRQMSDANSASQNLGVIEGALAIEARPQKLAWGKGFAHFSGGLLPTVVSAAQSPVSGAQSITAIPLEVGAGAYFGLSTFGLSTNRIGIDLGVSQVIGNSENLQATATVAKTALRLNLP